MNAGDFAEPQPGLQVEQDGLLLLVGQFGQGRDQGLPLLVRDGRLDGTGRQSAIRMTVLRRQSAGLGSGGLGLSAGNRGPD